MASDLRAKLLAALGRLPPSETDPLVKALIDDVCELREALEAGVTYEPIHTKLGPRPFSKALAASDERLGKFVKGGE